jgi:hypothetical protein
VLPVWLAAAPAVLSTTVAATAGDPDAAACPSASGNDAASLADDRSERPFTASLSVLQCDGV